LISAGQLRPKCRHVFTLLGVLLLVCGNAEAQTNSSSVMLRGTVSETVALSVLPNFTESNIASDGLSSGSTVRLTLSGTDADSPVIRVPLLVRSNSGFRISAAFESETAGLSELSVIETRATGSLVSPSVVNALQLNPHFDGEVSRPLLVLTGPRISLGGTLQSPNNALQITLVIRVKAVRAWTGHLTLTATAESQFQ
jgi:hypothetical protein